MKLIKYFHGIENAKKKTGTIKRKIRRYSLVRYAHPNNMPATIERNLK